MKLMIYDSGVGGEVVYQKLRERLRAVKSDSQTTPALQIDFFADHANFPYGRKTEAELKKIVETNLNRVFSEGYDSVGIACNTATIITQKFSLSRDQSVFIIVQPTVEKVLELDRQPVHVIASQFTFSTHEYSDQIKKSQPNWKISESAEQNLVEAIEKDEVKKVEQEVARIVRELDPTVKTLVLACTHFSKVKVMFEMYREKFHQTFTIVDSAEVLVELLEKQIKK